MSTRDAVCFRHDDRWAGVLCQRCLRPICTQCMVEAPVGYQCVECVREASRGQRRAVLTSDPVRVTQALIAANLIVFVIVLALTGSFEVWGGGATSVHLDFALNGRPIAEWGEWWRIISSAFLHYGLIHVGMNMLILMWVGRMLEPTIGPWRFALLYAACLFGGALGALLASPGGLTAGASGAVFGVAGAVVVAERARGVRWQDSGIFVFLVINIVLSLLIPRISIGGHFGGLIMGVLCGLLLWRLPTLGGLGRVRWLPELGVAALGLGAGAAAWLWAAPLWSDPLF